MTRLMVTALCCCSMSWAMACDVCGSSMGGTYLGFIPGERFHSFGLAYRQALFNIVHPNNDGSTIPLQNRFHSLIFNGKLSLAPRTHFFVSVPHTINEMEDLEGPWLSSGWGDPSIIGAYSLIRHLDSTTGLKHHFMVGGGVKAPVGDYNLRGNENLILPGGQPGTGSWDYLAYANYTLEMASWSFNAEANYAYNTPNPERYRFGNRTQIVAKSMYAMPLNRDEQALGLVQGVSYRHADRDLSNISKGKQNPYSGGQMLAGILGVNLKLGAWVWKTQANINLWQSYADGFVSNPYQITSEIKYTIQKK